MIALLSTILSSHFVLMASPKAGGASTTEEEINVKLPQGHMVEGKRGRFIVMKLLGEGGFGAVYKVADKENQKCYHAMKVEKLHENRPDSKLKMEIAILKAVAEDKQAMERSHFTKIIDRGKREKYCFVVMQLVGRSLADLKIHRNDHVFSPCCALGIAGQCLEALEDLHRHGYLHRDIKPANYACGRGSKRHIIYILDFGIARKFIVDGKHKPQRERTRFKGTIKFASIACHKGVDMAPKDDCESWFYLLIDIIQPDGLPWKRMTQKDAVGQCKEEYRKSEKKNELFEGLKCEKELIKIMEYLDGLKFVHPVNHEFIQVCLKRACRLEGGQITDPYDWEKVKDDEQDEELEEEEEEKKEEAKREERRKKRELNKKAGKRGGTVTKSTEEKDEREDGPSKTSKEEIIEEDNNSVKKAKKKDVEVNAVRRKKKTGGDKDVDVSTSVMKRKKPSGKKKKPRSGASKSADKSGEAPNEREKEPGGGKKKARSGASKGADKPDEAPNDKEKAKEESKMELNEEKKVKT